MQYVSKSIYTYTHIYRPRPIHREDKDSNIFLLLLELFNMLQIVLAGLKFANSFSILFLKKTLLFISDYFFSNMYYYF